MFQADRYQMIVIGGGPAGSAAAAVGALRGLDVLLLERSPSPTFKVGESLMPETYWTFEKMGALERLRRSHFPHKHSVQFFPRSGKASAPFYFDSINPHESAQTWQVLRSELDEMLFECAADRGAECWRAVSVREVLFDGDRATGVRVACPGEEPLEVAADVVVDASGQSSLIARALGLGRHSYELDHASLFTHFRGAVRDRGRDEGATLILHTRDGGAWFWYIPLPEDTVSVGVVGDVGRLVRAREGSPRQIFFEEVAACPEIARRIRDAKQTRPVQVLRDFSYRWDRMAGDGWVLAGDAFSFVDPVYSSGVFLALKTGELAAESAAAALEEGEPTAARLGAHEPAVRRAIGAVYGLVRAFYAPDFSFGAFLREAPHFQRQITQILVGDVFEPDFDDLFEAMRRFNEERGSETTAPAGAARASG